MAVASVLIATVAVEIKEVAKVIVKTVTVDSRLMRAAAVCH